MSTRSLIAMKELPKKKGGPANLKVIYCQWDGYPSNNGRILLENYTTPEAVRALLNLGNLSSLGPTLGDKHNFDNSDECTDDICTAYDRDRGETDQSATNYKYSNVIPQLGNELPKKFVKETVKSWCEYLYVFDEKTSTWFYGHIYDSITLQPLTKAVIGRNKS